MSIIHAVGDFAIYQSSLLDGLPLEGLGYCVVDKNGTRVSEWVETEARALILQAYHQVELDGQRARGFRRSLPLKGGRNWIFESLTTASTWPVSPSRSAEIGISWVSSS